GQKIFELEQRRLSARLVGRRGGVRRAVTDWTGVHHQPRPGGRAVGSSLDRRGEHWPKIEGRATERNRGSRCRVCSAGPGVGSRCLSEPQGRGEEGALPQRRHPMATNSSGGEVPLVVGTAPAISSRSILRNDAASA